MNQKTLRRTQRAADKGHNIDSLKLFTSKYVSDGSAGPNVRYLAADEFNTHAWNELIAAQPKFNLILSDALHEQVAVEYEFNQLMDNHMFDVDNGFAMVWDDCVSATGIRNAWNTFPGKLRKANPGKVICAGVFAIWGWLGEREGYKHHTCYITTLDVETMLKEDGYFGSLEVLQPVICSAAN